MAGEGARRRLADRDPLAYVQELAEYWAQSYEMRRVADQLNRYEQFTMAIDGVEIHFLRVRSPVQRATPCIMTHGWPGSVMEFVKVIDPLLLNSSRRCARGCALSYQGRFVCDVSGHGRLVGVADPDLGACPRDGA